MVVLTSLVLAALVPAVPAEAPPRNEWILTKEERGLRYVGRSPDGRWKLLVFGMRSVSGGGADDSIWAEFIETGEMTCLLGRSCPENGEQWGFSQFAFGVEADELFFVGGPPEHAGNWVQRLDLTTGKVAFVSDGSGIHVIQSGPHRGKLIVRRGPWDERDGGLRPDAEPHTDWLVDRSGRLLRRLPDAPSANIGSDGYTRWLRENGWE